MRRKRGLFSMYLAVGLIALAGCGDDGQDPSKADDVGAEADAGSHGDDVGADDAGTSDAGGGEDVLVIGDVGGPVEHDQRCDGKMADEWPFHHQTSNGAVTVTDEGGYFQATIDASAGGASAATSNPFLYVDLDANDRVAIDDFASWEDTSWDLAFKRTIIRSNGADSGPGEVRVAKVSGTTFAEATAPINPSAWAQDVSMDDDCEVLVDPIGQPVTAFNHLNPNNPTGSQSWYSYAGGVSPVAGDVYFVEGTEGTTYKVEILSWSMGVFTLRWAPLS